MFTQKSTVIQALREEFNRWEELISRLSDEQLTSPDLPSDLSIKDVVGHLRAWQQVSIARLTAAIQNNEPGLPAWLNGLDPDSDEHLEAYNARILEEYRHQPWSSVHQGWREGYLRFLDLAEQISEEDLTDTNKYPWLKGYALIDVLQGSYEHHQIDHFEPLSAWLKENGDLIL